MKYLFIVSCMFFMLSCKKQENAVLPLVQNKFGPSVLSVANPVKLVRGQVWYLPIYSNIPYKPGDDSYSLSGFAAVHNTDMEHPIRISQVWFFNNDGALVKDFLQDSIIILPPLCTTNFYIPEQDKSGLGANFIIEWTADTLVNEPLIESVMVNLTTGHGVSFLSQGRVIREVTSNE